MDPTCSLPPLALAPVFLYVRVCRGEKESIGSGRDGNCHSVPSLFLRWKMIPCRSGIFGEMETLPSFPVSWKISLHSSRLSPSDLSNFSSREQEFPSYLMTLEYIFTCMWEQDPPFSGPFRTPFLSCVSHKRTATIIVIEDSDGTRRKGFPIASMRCSSCCCVGLCLNAGDYFYVEQHGGVIVLASE